MQQHYRLNRTALQTMRQAFVVAGVVVHTWEVSGSTPADRATLHRGRLSTQSGRPQYWQRLSGLLLHRDPL